MNKKSILAGYKDRIVKLFQEEGLSSDRIAKRLSKELGRTITRNMVGSFLDRQHIARVNPHNSQAWRAQLPPKVVPLPKPKPKKQEAPGEPSTYLGPLNDFPAAGLCRYTPDDVAQPGWRMCGHLVAKNDPSFCPAHHAKVYDGFRPAMTEWRRSR